MWTVYVLELGDGTLYTGITTDLERRVRQHDTGRGARYTRGRGVVAVRYTERKRSHSAALRREAAIKKLPRSAKLALPG
jgi:predicted GIY-YIG superfamily endonuclease